MTFISIYLHIFRCLDTDSDKNRKDKNLLEMTNRWFINAVCLRHDKHFLWRSRRFDPQTCSWDEFNPLDQEGVVFWVSACLLISLAGCLLTCLLLALPVSVRYNWVSVILPVSLLAACLLLSAALCLSVAFVLLSAQHVGRLAALGLCCTLNNNGLSCCFSFQRSVLHRTVSLLVFL